MSGAVVVVVPEPSDWLGLMLREWPGLVGEEAGEVELVAPWMIGGAATVGRWLPGRLRAALERRSPAGVVAAAERAGAAAERAGAAAERAGVAAERAGVAVGLAGGGVSLAWPGVMRVAWLGVEGGVSAWAGSDVARRLRARFAVRRVIDRVAARRVGKARVVVAPSGAAEAAFAAAPVSCKRVLVADLPSLRRLHEDLDAAAAVHPEARFLRRFRAGAREVARQEAEWVLADRILVRGGYARDALVAAGVAVGRVTGFGDARGEARDARREARDAGREAVDADGGVVMLLAGGGAARGGSYEALAALERLPGATLVVSAGEGCEPVDLMSRGRVRASRHDEREGLVGIDVVIAPAWCESHPREVALARRLGVPVVATAQASGFAEAEVGRGDVEGLVAAVIRATSS